MMFSTINICKKMQIRGRKIFCINKIRMCILDKMWKDQKYSMMQNLKQLKGKMKESIRRKRLKKLIRLSDEVKDTTLKSYYSFCKERAAKAFIEWRIK